MAKKILYIFISFLLIQLFLFNACKSDGDSNIRDDFEIPEDVISEGVMEIAQESMEDIVENISSPIEMAALVQSLGVPYSRKYLAPTKNVDDYITSQSKAFNLGVFGADLGYLNMYNRTAAVIDYITAIKTLADGINVGQFFDFTTLKRLATNNQNLDSLMYISVHSFNLMDTYLRENNRSNLSALIIAGVWVEGLYLATQVAKERPDDRIAESIGEQQIILNQLMIVLNNYKKDKFITNLI
ncbi:unnamed protein product, partial [marine sediment metagenome]